MNQYQVTIHAGQLKFFVELMNQDSTFQLISKEKIKASYLVVTLENLEDVRQYLINKFKNLEGLYYLLQLEEVDN